MYEFGTEGMAAIGSGFQWMHPPISGSVSNSWLWVSQTWQK